MVESRGPTRIRNAIRTDIPNPARIYNYWLGGRDNFAIDRWAAERTLKLVPEMLDYARGNRDWLVRAVRYICAETSVRQFLDIGIGLPARPNVHEIAQVEDPGARVVYVDNDPVVFSHAQALMANYVTTSAVRADMRDSGEVLAKAGQMLDLSRPVALLFISSLQHLEEADDPAGLVGRYLGALAPGSYLVLSHCTDEFSYERLHQVEREARQSGAVFAPRGKDDILAMFNGRALVEPGLVLVSYWRPEGGQPAPNADRIWAYGGIAPL